MIKYQTDWFNCRCSQAVDLNLSGPELTNRAPERLFTSLHASSSLIVKTDFFFSIELKTQSSLHRNASSHFGRCESANENQCPLPLSTTSTQVSYHFQLALFYLVPVREGWCDLFFFNCGEESRRFFLLHFFNVTFQYCYCRYCRPFEKILCHLTLSSWNWFQFVATEGGLPRFKMLLRGMSTRKK